MPTPAAGCDAGHHKVFLGHGRRRRQDLPDAAGGPRRGRGRARRRDRLPRAAPPPGDRGAGRRPGGRAAAARRPTATSRSTRWTSRDPAPQPELCLIDELAHTNAPGRRARASATRTSRDVLDAGIDVFSTVNVQHLESLNDQITELTGTRVRETLPDRVSRRGRRGRARRPHARGADRAPARRQGLPGRAHRVGAQQLLQDREPRRAARGRAAPGRRGGRGQAARARDRPRRRATTTACSRAPPRRPSASGCSRSSSRRRSPSASCAARGARPSGCRPSSTSSGSARTSPTDGEREQLDALRRLATAARRRTCSSSAATTSPRPSAGRRRARHHLRADGHAAAPRSALRPPHRPLPFRLLQLLPGVDLRIVADRSRRNTEEQP